MKKIAIALFMVTFGATACAKEEPKEKTLPPVTVTAPAPEPEAPKTKKVCIEQKDAKTGKMVPVCKTVKVHKKLEGTKIEDAKKDSKK